MIPFSFGENHVPFQTANSKIPKTGKPSLSSGYAKLSPLSQYRSPIITALWPSQREPGLSQPVSPDLFEQLIFSRLYFDYDGLIFAFDDGRPVGFVHAGFGPLDGQSYRLSTELGVVCLMMLEPGCSRNEEVAAGLMERAEGYLHRRGAKVLYGGCMNPLNPFYLGLYGGSELPGLLDSDKTARQACESRGYPGNRTDANLADQRHAVRVAHRPAADANPPEVVVNRNSTPPHEPGGKLARLANST